MTGVDSQFCWMPVSTIARIMANEITPWIEAVFRRDCAATGFSLFCHVPRPRPRWIWCFTVIITSFAGNASRSSKSWNS